MGEYTIVIAGIGETKQAVLLAAQLVHDLKQAGQSIKSAVLNTDTTTDDLDALTRPGNQTFIPTGAGAPIDGEGEPNPQMKIFKIEAQGDILTTTEYVQAVDIAGALAAFHEDLGPIPDELLTVTEVPALPEGEELLNPLAA
jgi:hypothetical protein